MKNTFTFKALIIAVFSFLFLHSSAQTKATDNTIAQLVEIQNANYSMGKIPAGKPVEYNVTVKNISKDTISIQRVQAGCGCTIPKYAAGQVLKPGDVTMITLGFDGKATGPFTKFADIYFGNGQSTKLKFTGEAIKQ